jgi:uncharacterized repeat protein (TIGR03806 family)
MKSAVTLSLIILLGVFPAAAQLTRQDNTTLKFPVAPSTATGQYQLVELMPGVSFDRPVCIANAPNDTRLFVVERAGRIWVINDIANPQKEMFLDISSRVDASDWINVRRTEGLSSIAFHPDFAGNHRFFVTYNTIATTAAGTGHHNRVSEFRASLDNKTGVPTSEIVMISQYDEGDGHNINDLHFGPDGYLYIATGDEGDGNTGGDEYNNAQKIDKDFFSAIMRIDVDKRSGNLMPNAHAASNSDSYRIPSDNPFVGASSFNGRAVDPQKVRTEFFAVGLRNPWRFSFDPQTQKIYEGDVGQHFREEVNVIVKGGNYGWSFKEGESGNGPKFASMPAGANIISPIWEYQTPNAQNQDFSGTSVTGGVVYRGEALPGLNGHLIFSDFVSGNIWALNIDAQPYPENPIHLMGQAHGSTKGIASFGYDPRNGDVLLVNHDIGKILRLNYSLGEAENIPLSLDKTGIFADLATLRPNMGIYPYDVNVPLWSDDARKLRWFSVPPGKKFGFSAAGNWTFPTGSIFVKHFDLETKLGDPATAIRIETRVLYKTDNSVYGLTYKWDTNGANAYLVPDGGDTRGIIVNTGTTNRRQTWRFPSRSECLTCHTASGGRILGFTTAQLNRDYGYGSLTTNQITALSTAGFLDTQPGHVGSLHALAPLDDNSASLGYRARSYLAANCSQCHQPGANVGARWDGRITTPVSQAGLIQGDLINAGSTGDKVITPGLTNKSAILKRMMEMGTNRMPPLGTTVVDRQAIQLISDWVTKDLPSYKTYETWAGQHFTGTAPARDADFDGDGVSNYAEYLLNTNPKQSNPPLAKAAGTNNQVTLTFNQPANVGVLFEWAPEVPPRFWFPLTNSQNRLMFPAQTSNRTINDSFNGQRRFYRARVIEP